MDADILIKSVVINSQTIGGNYQAIEGHTYAVVGDIYLQYLPYRRLKRGFETEIYILVDSTVFILLH